MRYVTVAGITILMMAAGCHEQPDVTKMAREFAEIEGRAIGLRQQRFALANEIRFAEDTMLHARSADTLRLKKKLEQLAVAKAELLQQSLVTADTIKRQLDSINYRSGLSTDEKREFHTQLGSILKAKYSATNG